MSFYYTTKQLYNQRFEINEDYGNSVLQCKTSPFIKSLWFKKYTTNNEQNLYNHVLSVMMLSCNCIISSGLWLQSFLCFDPFFNFCSSTAKSKCCKIKVKRFHDNTQCNKVASLVIKHTLTTIEKVYRSVFRAMLW